MTPIRSLLQSFPAKPESCEDYPEEPGKQEVTEAALEASFAIGPGGEMVASGSRQSLGVTLSSRRIRASLLACTVERPPGRRPGVRSGIDDQSTVHQYHAWNLQSPFAAFKVLESIAQKAGGMKRAQFDRRGSSGARAMLRK